MAKIFSSLSMAALALAVLTGCMAKKLEQDAVSRQQVQKLSLKSATFQSRFQKQDCVLDGDSFECTADVVPGTKQNTHYLSWTIEIEPVRLDKASLCLDMEMDRSIVAQFYVRGKNAAGETVVSHYVPGGGTIPSHAMLTPGKDCDGFRWFSSDVRGLLDDEIVSLKFDALIEKEGRLTVKCSNLEAGGEAPSMKTIPALDLGPTVRAGTHRGIYATRDADGRDAVVVWLMDDLNRRNLQIDAETGECVEIPLPNAQKPDAVYASLISRDELIYSLVGGHFLEYDPKSRSFTGDYACPHAAGMSMAEAPDGTIWTVAYPDSGLVSFNPATREFTDYGTVNTEKWAQLPRCLVLHSDGWLYVGIGSNNGQIVAFNPAERKAFPLLTDEKYRVNPSIYYVFAYSDGNVYAHCSKKDEYWFRLENGKATFMDKAPDAEPVLQRTGTQFYVQDVFPSGRRLKGGFQPVDMRLVTTDADGNDGKTVNFSFKTTYCGLMGVDVTEDGILGGGGYFPFRFGTVNLSTGAATDEFCNEQCNAITAGGKYFYIGGYCGGQLMKLDPRKPWTLEEPMKQNEPRFDTNPVFYGKADPVVNRPHAIAVTPEGDKFIVGGTPGYGMTGGGIAIVDLKTNHVDIVGHEHLAQYESPSALAPLGNNLLVIGTTVEAGSGGEVKAKGVSLMLYDMKQKKLLWKEKYGKPNVGWIKGLIALDESRVLGLAGTELFIFDTQTLQYVARTDIAAFGKFAGGEGARLLHKDARGNIYAVFASGLGQVDIEGCGIGKFRYVPGGIGVGGGIYKEHFYYSTGTRFKAVSLESFYE